MEHPIVVTSDNKICDKPNARQLSNSIRDAIKMIESWDLKPSVYLMNQADYDDIVKWAK